MEIIAIKLRGYGKNMTINEASKRCTDPKGEILRSCGQMLKNNGYNVKVINLLEMDKSDCYNSFSYIREETDVEKSAAADSANASNGSAGAKPVRNPEREKPKWEDTITNRMLHWSYTTEQKEEVKKALAAGVPKATILTYFYPEVTVEKMSAYRQKQ